MADAAPALHLSVRALPRARSGRSRGATQAGRRAPQAASAASAPRGWTSPPTAWIKRPGRPKVGHLDARAAHVAAEALVRTVELELREIERRAGRTAPTFREVTEAWLEWLETVKGVKPSTLRDHRYVLAEPGTPHKRGGGTSAGVVMGALGDLPASTVTTRQVEAALSKVAASGAGPGP